MHLIFIHMINTDFVLKLPYQFFYSSRSGNIDVFHYIRVLVTYSNQVQSDRKCSIGRYSVGLLGGFVASFVASLIAPLVAFVVALVAFVVALVASLMVPLIVSLVGIVVGGGILGFALVLDMWHVAGVVVDRVRNRLEAAVRKTVVVLTVDHTIGIRLFVLTLEGVGVVIFDLVIVLVEIALVFVVVVGSVVVVFAIVVSLVGAVAISCCVVRVVVVLGTWPVRLRFADGGNASGGRGGLGVLVAYFAFGRCGLGVLVAYFAFGRCGLGVLVAGVAVRRYGLDVVVAGVAVGRCDLGVLVADVAVQEGGLSVLVAGVAVRRRGLGIVFDRRFLDATAGDQNGHQGGDDQGFDHGAS